MKFTAPPINLNKIENTSTTFPLDGRSIEGKSCEFFMTDFYIGQQILRDKTLFATEVKCLILILRSEADQVSKVGRIRQITRATDTNSIALVFFRYIPHCRTTASILPHRSSPDHPSPTIPQENKGVFGSFVFQIHTTLFKIFSIVKMI